MGNARNRKRKKVRITPSKNAKRFKHGPEGYENPEASGKKISDQSAKLRDSKQHKDAAKEGTIFMNL